jgi:hypothetical protein
MRAGKSLGDFGELVTDVVADLNHFIGYHRRRIIVEIEHMDELSNALAAADALRKFIRETLYPVGQDPLNETHIELIDAYLSEFETALKIDLRTLPIYVLEDKRGYSARLFVIRGNARQVLSKKVNSCYPHARWTISIMQASV